MSLSYDARHVEHMYWAERVFDEAFEELQERTEFYADRTNMMEYLDERGGSEIGG